MAMMNVLDVAKTVKYNNDWELGITWFLGLYTTVGMYIPALAYLITFRHLLKDMKGKEGKDKWIYRFYTIMAVPLSPIIVILR